MNEKRKRYQRRLKLATLVYLVLFGTVVAVIACGFVAIKNAHIERSNLRRILLSKIKLQEKKVETVGLRVETLRNRRALANALKYYRSRLIPIEKSYVLRSRQLEPPVSLVLGGKVNPEISLIDIKRPGG